MNVNIADPIFHNEDKARAHIEKSRWNGVVDCPHCGSARVTRMGGKTQAGMFLCNDCRDKFTARTGTVMERSHIPMHKWLLATHLLAASKKGMSAKQMERMLGLTYKTAWFLCHRIREAMAGANDTGPLGAPGKFVEADETFVGGRNGNRAFKKPAPKKKVVALVERGGRAHSFPVANIHGNAIRSALVTSVDSASTLMSYEAHHYKAVGREFASHGQSLVTAGACMADLRITCITPDSSDVDRRIHTVGGADSYHTIDEAITNINMGDRSLAAQTLQLTLTASPRVNYLLDLERVRPVTPHWLGRIGIAKSSI